MARTKSEWLVSVYPRLVVREVGQLRIVDYDLYSTCEHLNEQARLRFASRIERYYECDVPRVSRIAFQRRYGRLYVGPTSGLIVAKPEHLDPIISLVLETITDPKNFAERDVRASRAIEATDKIMADKGLPIHAERIRMARRFVSSGYPDVGSRTN